MRTHVLKHATAIVTFFTVSFVFAAAVDGQTTQPAAASAPASKPAAPSDPLEDFITKSKNPAPWMNWGMDLRLRDEWFINSPGFNKATTTNEQHFQRYRARWWTTLTPMKDLDVYARFTWEGRYYCSPERNNSPVPDDYISRGWIDERDQVLIDNLYVKYSNAFGLPVTITAGRQDITLGDGWWTGDGTPLDGSRTFYFDALRAALDLKDIKTTIETILINQDAQFDAWFPKLKNELVPPNISDSDENAVIVYVTNKSLPKTQIDGYFVAKHSEIEYTYGRPSGFNGDVYMFGTRFAGDITDHWRYRVDVAGQFGHRNGQNICALGSNDRLTYAFNDKWKNELFLDYEYLSGDKPGTKGTYEGFDILWGRYPRWTELGTIWIPESGDFNFTNMHRVGPGWQAKPLAPLEVGFRYNAVFADTKPFANTGQFGDGCFRGNLLVFYLKYTINKHLFIRVMPEVFFPGDYYADTNNDPATFSRVELNFTW